MLQVQGINSKTDKYRQNYRRHYLYNRRRLLKFKSAAMLHSSTIKQFFRFSFCVGSLMSIDDEDGDDGGRDVMICMYKL